MEIRKNVERLREFIMFKYGSENTAKNYCSALEKFLYHFKEYPEPKSISDDLIIKYLLSIPGRRNRCTHHSAIKKFYFIRGQKHKFKYIPYPEKEDKLPIHVNKEEFLKLISFCENDKHRAILSIIFDAGLRVGEVINLRLDEIDSSNMIINVVSAKGRKDRKVKLTSVLLSILRAYYLKYKPKEYLFEGQFGGKYSARSIQEIVKNLCIKAQIEKKFSPHKFRHGFAMTLLENGEGLDRIGNQMGHQSIKTTEIYARMNNTVIQKIESPLEQIVKSSSLSVGQMKSLSI